MSSFRHNLAVGASFDIPPPADLDMQIYITYLCSERRSFPISDCDGHIRALLDPISLLHYCHRHRTWFINLQTGPGGIENLIVRV